MRTAVSTWPRYLVMAAKDSSVVDPMWSYKAFQKRENDSDSDSDSEEKKEKSHPSISAGVAQLEGQEKVYLYSGRRMGVGQVDFTLISSWMQHCAKEHSGCQSICV